MLEEGFKQLETGFEGRIFPKEEIDKIFHEGHESGGHGTSIEVAPEILLKGIRVNEAYGLHEILMPLSGLSDSKIESLLAAWPHKSARAVVIVCVPNQEGFNRPEDIVGEIFDENLHRTRSYVPPNFVKGYFDVEQQKFVDNPGWEINPTPLVKQVKPQLRKPKTFNNPVPMIEMPEQGGDSESMW
jgi:hypothetical protein